MLPVRTLDLRLGTPCAHAARGTRHRPRAACACASAGKADEALPPFTYNSSDGRPKATIEQALSFPPSRLRALLAAKLPDCCLTGPAAGPAHRLVRAHRQWAARPWQIGWQVNERNVVWSDDLKLRLIKARRPAVLSRLPGRGAPSQLTQGLAVSSAWPLKSSAAARRRWRRGCRRCKRCCRTWWAACRA